MNINESYIFICQFSIVFLDLLAHPGIFFWVVFLPIRCQHPLTASAAMVAAMEPW